MQTQQTLWDAVEVCSKSLVLVMKDSTQLVSNAKCKGWLRREVNKYSNHQVNGVAPKDQISGVGYRGCHQSCVRPSHFEDWHKYDGLHFRYL